MRAATLNSNAANLNPLEELQSEASAATYQNKPFYMNGGVDDAASRASMSDFGSQMQGANDVADVDAF